MSAASLARIELLNKNNYDTWKLQMKAILIKSDLWDYANGTIVKPQAGIDPTAVQDWAKYDGKAMSDIILSISSSELKQVKNCETAHAMWQRLQAIYQSTGPARKATLLKNLTLHKMADGADVREHLNNFFDTVDKLADMNVDINADLLTIMILYSLPAKFENFRCAIESRDQLPTPDALRIKIIEESDARKNDASGTSSDAMIVKRYNGRRDRKPKSEALKNDRSDQVKKKSNLNLRCFKCDKIGHKASECRSEHKRQIAKSAEDVCLNVSNVFSFSSSEHNQRWCLDSGASSHLCNKRRDFCKISDCERGSLNLANDTSTRITATGTVQFEADVLGNKKNILLNKALHVPDLRTNLLSVSKMTDRGFEVHFRKDSAVVLDLAGDVKLCADRIGDLYYAREYRRDVCIAESALTTGEITFELWHRRMGHMNAKDISTAKREGIIQGIRYESPIDKLNCDICLKSKMTRNSFPKWSTRQTNILDLVHTDVCGPMRVESNGHARYFVVFIDDKSRWCEVRFVNSKKEVFKSTTEYIALVENQKGTSVKCLQSDNGTEYTSLEFNNYLKKRGIARRLTIPYNPEQNGVAERKNRTLLDTARCLMIESGLPASFWAEAINTANHIRNRSPSKSLNGKTPYELWTGKAPDVNHFKVFGSQVIYLDRQPGKGKFDPRGRKGIFLGYAEESKGYRIWSVDDRNIVISRDVKVIDEDKRSLEKFNEFVPEEQFEVESDIEYPSDNQNFMEIPLETTTYEDYQSNDQAENNETNDDDIPADTRRGRGRPTFIRTGTRGRPRKVYQPFTKETNIAEVEQIYLAEVSMKQAMCGPNANDWCRAIDDEIRSIVRNDTWTLVDRPEDNEVIGSRMVLRNKFKSDGTLERRKARLVAQGFSQQPGIHFLDTFAPVARHSSIRLMTSLAVKCKMKIRQFDVTTAYLNGELEERILMEPPKNLQEILERIIEREENDILRLKLKKMLCEFRKGNKVCSLKKSLYGLRQAGRCWHAKLDKVLRKNGANPTHSDPCLYTIGSGEDLVLIAVYVDDILVASRNEKAITKFGQGLSRYLEIKNLGDVKYCLGIEFTHNGDSIGMHQQGYISDLLNRFGMVDSKPVATPIDGSTKLKKNEFPINNDAELPYRELVGALTYLATTTRPDISFAASYLGQFNNCYGTEHWKAAKRVLRYLKGTSDLGLVFVPDNAPVRGFVDADWGSNIEDRRSYSGYIFTLNGAPISWDAKKQKTVALSTTEAEYMAMAECAKECTYLRRFLEEIGFAGLTDITVHCDNHSAIKLAENPTFHARSKHIDIRHHFIRDMLKSKQLKISYISTEDQIADMLTKGLPRPKHVWCMKSCGLGTSV